MFKRIPMVKKLSAATLLGIAVSSASAAIDPLSHRNMGVYMGLAPAYSLSHHKGAAGYLGYKGITYQDVFRIGPEVQVAYFGAPYGVAHPTGMSYANLSAMISYEIGRFEVFGKVGVSRITKYPNLYCDKPKYCYKPKQRNHWMTGPSVGVGAAYRISAHVAARAEWHQDFSIGNHGFHAESGGSGIPGFVSAGLMFMF